MGTAKSTAWGDKNSSRATRSRFRDLAKLCKESFAEGFTLRGAYPMMLRIFTVAAAGAIALGLAACQPAAEEAPAEPAADVMEEAAPEADAMAAETDAMAAEGDAMAPAVEEAADDATETAEEAVD